ncbi:hypothetical protein LPJ75_000342 [Coemansia sp. RSA 2598]|nr:hypothetical protein LPJ75_000342 [Coemansia sp. RSA 2598]
MSSDASPAVGSDNNGPTANGTPGASAADSQEKRVPHIRIVPHIVDVRHCLYFDVMNREVPEGTVLKVGRFTEKVSQQMSRIAFKSKVVSRSHAEIWTENGQFYIKDTKSSSGTFLNHIRLSPPSVESRPHPLHDGDILQLGVDYQGGTLDIYKCVKIRLEINRNWQRSKENPFRQQVMQNIQNAYHQIGSGGQQGAGGGGVDGDGANTECCICLYQMVAFQALFVAPCSHCFHFKCVKPILFTSTGFSCPLCRTYADLEASVTIDENEMDVDARPPPALLPPAIQQQQQQQQQSQSQSQPTSAHAASSASAAEAAVAAAAAVDAVLAANGGSGASSDAMGESAGAISMNAERDDANSTPVPSEQAAIDLFSTTPVDTMANNLTQFGEGGMAHHARAANSESADMSLVSPDDGSGNGNGATGGGASSGSDMHIVSSPGRRADSSSACATSSPGGNGASAARAASPESHEA